MTDIYKAEAMNFSMSSSVILIAFSGRSCVEYSIVWYTISVKISTENKKQKNESSLPKSFKRFSNVSWFGAGVRSISLLFFFRFPNFHIGFSIRFFLVTGCFVINWVEGAISLSLLLDAEISSHSVDSYYKLRLLSLLKSSSELISVLGILIFVAIVSVFLHP